MRYQSQVSGAVDDFPVVVVEKSRRTGFSWAASFIADIRAATSPADGGMDVFYMGYNLEMAREFIDYCAEHARHLSVVSNQVQEDFWIDPENPEKSIKVFRIDLASGNKILALPSRPRALRGLQGLVIIDEAAFHDDLEELLKSAMALTMWGGKILVISTHDGDQNQFNTLVTDIRAGRKPYHLMRVTLDDALADGLFHKICQKTRTEYSPEAEYAWRERVIAEHGEAADQELFCIPSQGSGTYLSLALIEARQEAEVPVIRWSRGNDYNLFSERVRVQEAQEFCRDGLEPVLAVLDAETPHCAGVDFGRTVDLTVIWVLGIEKNTARRTKLVVELRNIPFEQQKQILHHILTRLPRFRAIALDARGNGQYLAEVTVQKFGERATAVMISEKFYREETPPLKAAFEDGTIGVPQDREIIDDLRALKTVRGVACVPDVRTNGKTGKRHGDAAIALIMAYSASRMPEISYEYERIEASHLPGQVDGPGDIEREIERDRLGLSGDDSGVWGSL